MPSERVAMRRVRDVIRLKEAGVGVREIARLRHRLFVRRSSASRRRGLPGRSRRA
jgi:hypothetical protein